MINELASVFKLITKFLPDDEIIIVGDFNMPNITWQPHDDHPGCLIATSFKYKYEEKFVETLTSFCLKQINHISNQFGIFLDLIIATDITNVTIHQATGTQLLDATTNYHRAYIIELTYMSTNILAHDQTMQEYI